MGKIPHTKSLTELVFQSRNQAYGSYQLRKRYPKTLLVSVLIGIGFGLFVAIAPFFFFMMKDMHSMDTMNYIYEIEYIPFIPPDDATLVQLAKAHAIKPEERSIAPVVIDSVTPEKRRIILDPLSKQEEIEPEEGDTSSYGTGGEDIGWQANTDTALAMTIDVYPRYPGGVESRMYYLRRNVAYPKEAIEQRIQGVVMVLFVIETDGTLSNISILQGIGGGCDEEAVRVTKAMPKWTPGKRGGKSVRVMVKMPIIFRLPGNTNS